MYVGSVCHEATRVRTGYLGVNSIHGHVPIKELKLGARFTIPPIIIITNKDTNNLTP